MYFRVEATHTIGCTYDIIFGNRCTEYTGIAKLLLHAFGDIKYASFFFVCHILSPDKGIGIASELRFQCFINSSHHKSLLSFYLLVSSIRVLLRFIRFRQYKVKNRLRIGIGSSKCFAIGSTKLFFRFGFYLLQILFRESFVTEQHPAEFHQRIGIFHIGKFVLIAVKGMLVRIGMRTDTDTIGMYNHRGAIGNGKLTGFGHRIHRVEHVFAVTMNDFQILKAGEVIGNFTVGSLLIFRDRDTITIVLPYKDNRQALKTGPIDSFINKALGGGRFTM